MQKCKICQSDTLSINDIQMGWIFHKCPNCLFISKDSAFIIDEEKEQKQYSFHNNTIENDGYVQMFETFINEVILPLKKSGDTLDFGCGPGPVLATLLEQKGFEVTKYDKYFHPHESYKQNRYDIITSTEVIEHLENPLDYFELFISLLKPDGILCLMSLFHPNDDDKFLQWWYRRDITHISFYHPKTIEYICLILGLKISYIDDKNSIVLSSVNKK